MTAVGAVAALLLAGVFAVAAVAKLHRPARAAADFAGLRLPAARALAVAVPIGEAALGVALVMRPRAGGVVALVALAVFSVVLAPHVRGRGRVVCGCFGGGSAGGASVLWRNAGLGVLAVLAAAGPAGGVWPAARDLAAIVAVGAGVVTGAAGIGLLRLREEVGPLLALPLLQPGERR